MAICTPIREEVRIPVGDISLKGNLIIPPDATGIVLFAHGSGSSRFSTRNQHVAKRLHQHGLGTLLIDLLTAEEERIDGHASHLRFDIPFLADRLAAVVDWLIRNPQTAGCSIGVFGASTGGGAAIMLAAIRPTEVRAVVSRGGRPDLAKSALSQATCPTLLIVGGHDSLVFELNQQALLQLGSTSKELAVVSDATHLFEEPGALDKVARLAGEWFRLYLTPA